MYALNNRLKAPRTRYVGCSTRGLVPKNGDINREFGVYKNLCCGAEIVIAANVTFPDCANHINLPTEWKNIANADRVPHVTELDWKKKKNPAA
jgi:hypothetical protein